MRMTESERLVRVRYYAEKLGELYLMSQFGDTGFRACRLLDAIMWLTLPPQTAANRQVFELMDLSGRFSESDNAVKEANL